MFDRITLHTLQTTKTKAASKNSTVKYHILTNKNYKMAASFSNIQRKLVTDNNDASEVVMVINVTTATTSPKQLDDCNTLHETRSSLFPHKVWRLEASAKYETNSLRAKSR